VILNLLLNCKKISIDVFPKKKLRGLNLSFYIHVSVSYHYILTIGPPIFLQQNRQTDRGNWDCGRAVPFLGIFVSIFGIVFLQCSNHLQRS
jgi:hypothetical protein